jgi:hypothetical protein
MLLPRFRHIKRIMEPCGTDHSPTLAKEFLLEGGTVQGFQMPTMMSGQLFMTTRVCSHHRSHRLSGRRV